MTANDAANSDRATNAGLAARVAARRKDGPEDHELMDLATVAKCLAVLHGLPPGEAACVLIETLDAEPVALPLYWRGGVSYPVLVDAECVPMTADAWPGEGHRSTYPSGREKALQGLVLWCRYGTDLDPAEPAKQRYESLALRRTDACKVFGFGDGSLPVDWVAAAPCPAPLQQPQLDAQAASDASGFPVFEKCRRFKNDKGFCKAIAHLLDSLEGTHAPTQLLAKHYGVSGRHIRICGAIGRALIKAEPSKENAAKRKPATPFDGLRNP